MKIPKIIHQTVFQKNNIHQKIQDNIAVLKNINPGWQHRLYDDEDAKAFIFKHFGNDMLQCFESINPLYGAAKADFFRYLLMYVEGGVYLDVKSTATRNLDEVLSGNDRYILSTWRNKEGQEFEGWGKHAGFGPDGEYQQWHIVAPARHPFLESVIERVKENIENYDLGSDGVGFPGVLRLTGPKVYTEVIRALESDHEHQKLDVYDIGFRYSISSGVHHDHLIGGTHYAKRVEPVVIQPTNIRRQRAMDYFSSLRNGDGDPAKQLLAHAFLANTARKRVRFATSHGSVLVYQFALDECIHVEPDDDLLLVDVQANLIGKYISFFSEIGGLRFDFGVNQEGRLTRYSENDKEALATRFEIHAAKNSMGRFNLSSNGLFLCAEGRWPSDMRSTIGEWVGRIPHC